MTPEARAARDRLARYARPDFPMPAPDLPDALGPFTAAQLNRVTDERAENNWSMCVLSAGAADANTAAGAALHVQRALRRDYDLTTD